MGKHEHGFARISRDLYPTPAWVVDALAEHVAIAGKTIWEPACGTGQMVAALKAAGAARVICTDAHDYGYNGIFDFVGPDSKVSWQFDIIATNPAYGERNKLAEKFIEVGLRRLPPGGLLALLLPVDFDCAVSRRHLFHDEPRFRARSS
jgi:tRNA G10  N-methylase Trm11